MLSSLATLSIDYLTHGTTPDSEKLIRKAASQRQPTPPHTPLPLLSSPSHLPCVFPAESLGVDVAVLTASIHALSFLLLDSAKRHLTPEDFLASLPPLSLPPSHLPLLTSTFTQHLRLLSSLLSSSSLSLPSYSSLDWRLDVITHTRAATSLTIPTYLLSLSLTHEGRPVTHFLQSDYAALVALEKELEAAVKGLNTKEATRIRRYVK